MNRTTVNYGIQKIVDIWSEHNLENSKNPLVEKKKCVHF